MHQPKQPHSLPKGQVLTSVLFFCNRAVAAQWIPDLCFKIFIDNIMLMMLAMQIWPGWWKKAGRIQLISSYAKNKMPTPSTLLGVKHWAAGLSLPLSRFRCSVSQVARHHCIAILPERRLWHDPHAAEHQRSCEQPVILITRPVENKGFKTNGANISWWFKEKRLVTARIYSTKGQSLPVLQRWPYLAKCAIAHIRASQH